MDETKLKPCPFCGDKGVVQRNGHCFRVYCLNLSIRGGLANAEALLGCITVDGKTLNTVPEVKNFLREQLDMGRECLPFGDCDNFDYKTGCKGHFVEE